MFGEIASAVARRIDGGTLVAHNLPFDTRMLACEFERLGVAFDSGAGLCTFRATGDKLGIACARFGIELSLQHRALADARANCPTPRATSPPTCGATPEPRRSAISRIPPVHERCAGKRRGPHPADLARVVSHAYYPSSDEALLQYLDALDWVLDDRRIDERERAELVELADSLAISPEQRTEAHRSYLASIIAAARRDGIITEAERRLIKQAADTLDLADVTIPEVTRVPAASNLRQGMHVCFTGEAIVRGQSIGRAGVGTTCRMRRPATRAIGHEEGMRPSRRGRSFEPVR